MWRATPLISTLWKVRQGASQFEACLPGLHVAKSRGRKGKFHVLFCVIVTQHSQSIWLSGALLGHPGSQANQIRHNHRAIMGGWGLRPFHTNKTEPGDLGICEAAPVSSHCCRSSTVAEGSDCRWVLGGPRPQIPRACWSVFRKCCCLQLRASKSHCHLGWSEVWCVAFEDTPHPLVFASLLALLGEIVVFLTSPFC